MRISRELRDMIDCCHLVSQSCRELAPQGPRNAKRRQDFSCRQAVHSICKNFFCSSQSAGSPTFNVASDMCSGRAPMIASSRYGLGKVLRQSESRCTDVKACPPHRRQAAFEANPVVFTVGNHAERYSDSPGAEIPEKPERSIPSRTRS